MKIKVFFAVLFSFLLVLAISGTSKEAGKSYIKFRMDDMHAKFIGKDLAKDLSLEEIISILESPQHRDQFSRENKKALNDIHNFSIYKLCIELVMYIFVAFLCSRYVIKVSSYNRPL